MSAAASKERANYLTDRLQKLTEGMDIYVDTSSLIAMNEFGIAPYKIRNDGEIFDIRTSRLIYKEMEKKCREGKIPKELLKYIEPTGSSVHINEDADLFNKIKDIAKKGYKESHSLDPISDADISLVLEVYKTFKENKINGKNILVISEDRHIIDTINLLYEDGEEKLLDEEEKSTKPIRIISICEIVKEYYNNNKAAGQNPVSYPSKNGIEQIHGKRVSPKSWTHCHRSQKRFY